MVRVVKTLGGLYSLVMVFVAAEGIRTEEYCYAGNSAGTGNGARRCPGCFQGARDAARNPKTQGAGASFHSAQVKIWRIRINFILALK